MTSPRVALLLVGDELLDGRVADTNGPYFADRLREHGVELARAAIVGDGLEEIVSALEHLLAHASFVVCAGGIGPTADDRTRAAIAALLGVDLVEHEPSWRSIVERFERLGRTPSPTNRLQALHPRGSRVLANAIGTAPGFVAETCSGARVAAIPGVPSEARRMFDEQIVPLVAGEAEIPQRTLLFAGVPESHFGELLAAEMNEAAEARVGITAAWSFLRVTIRATSAPSLDRVAARVRTLGEEWWVGEGSAHLEDLLVEALRIRGEHVSVAESCTGGGVAARITGVSGASDVFDESVVTYADRAKTEHLGVAPELLAQHGAVSEETVRAMVSGLARRTGAELCGAISGIAGPSGGSEEKPVGLVWFATSYRGEIRVRERRYGNPGRAVVRERAASDLLLYMLQAVIAGQPPRR